MRLKKVIKLIIYLIPLSLFLFVLWKNVAPFGAEITYTYDFGKDSEFISGLKPAYRVSKIKRGDSTYYQALQDDIVYFDLKLTRNFTKANVKVKFKNDVNPEFLIGVRDREEWHYPNKPLDNKRLNALKWKRLEKDGLVLFQKKKHYAKLDDFFLSPPRGSVATYFYEPPPRLLAQEYGEPNDELVIGNSLRGSHTLYTYVRKEPLNFSIEKQDLNWYEGADILTIDVLKGNERVYRVTIEDDGVLDSSKKMVAPQITRIEIPRSKLPGEGAYKIQLGCSEDVLIRRISVQQDLLVFENRVFLAENNLYTQSPTRKGTIFTEAKAISVKTYHQAGLQTLRVADTQDLEIAQPKTDYFAYLPQGLSKIESVKNDIVISGPGFFSFSKSSYFQPKPYPSLVFGENTDLNETDYIIAGYSLPGKENGWLVNEQTFDLSKAYIKDNTVSFAFFAPGLKENNNEILIDYIQVTLKKPSIFKSQTAQKLARTINSFLGRK